MTTRTKYFVSELVAEVRSLPSLAARIVSLTADPNCDLPSLSRLILSDSVLTMRFLALANSAAFGHGLEITDLRRALVRLGIRRVRNVALLMGMHDMTPQATADLPLDLNAYWKHCLAVASCAQGLARLQGGTTPDDAWLVGILQGLGVSALAEHTGPDFRQALSAAAEDGCSLAAAELRVLGFHHGELGARILRAWDLPRVLAEVIEFQPEDFAPDEVSERARDLIGTLRGAVLLARAIGYDQCGDGDPVPGLVTVARRLQLADDALDQLALEVDREVRELSDLIGLNEGEDRFADALAASRESVAEVGLAGLDEGLIREDLEEQLAAAREIQKHILPHTIPDLAGFELAAVNQPSKLVSGDTYDFITLADGARGFVIADVAGKGMPAALLASTLQASIRALAPVCADPGQLLAAANRALCDSTDDERFATVFLAVVDCDGTGLRYAGAGHNPPLLRRSAGHRQWLKSAGPPLGLLPDVAYPVQRVELGAGDLVIAYTDGVTEAVDGENNEFGPANLAAAVDRAVPGPPAVIIAELTAAVRDHCNPRQQSHPNELTRQAGSEPLDDLTVVLLKKTT